MWQMKSVVSPSRAPLMAALAVFTAATVVGPSVAQAEPSAPFCMVVLHNNDGESELLPESSGSADFGGVARFASVVQALRADAATRPLVAGQPCVKRGTLMLSSGDNFLAGSEFDASLAKGVPFFDSVALDTVRYDASAIGNHEFDFGPDVLADFITGFQRSGPFISANLDLSGEPRLQALEAAGRIAKSTVRTLAGEKIGIVGATTERLPTISSPRNVKVLPVVETVQAEIDALTNAGVNKIIFISHLQSIEEDKLVLAELRGVDIAIAGGGDDLLANPDDVLIPGDKSVGPYPLLVADADGIEIPVITTAGSYGYVGRLMVSFDDDGNVTGIDDASGPVRVAGGSEPDAVAANARIERTVVTPVRTAVETLATTVVGNTAVGLDGRRTQVRTVETNLGNLIADALLWQAEQLAASFGMPKPDVALQNGGGIRNNDIRGPGDLTGKDVADILPFANFVAIAPAIPREQFKLILENAVSRVAFTDGRFAQIAGFRMEWDPARTPLILDTDGNITQEGERVRNVVLVDGDGTALATIVKDGEVVSGDPVVVASIDFLFRGGDQYPYDGAPFTSVGVTYQRALSNYMATGLGGMVTASDYPQGGEGRITRTPAP